MEFCRALDPTGQYESVYNRYALSGFIMARGTRDFYAWSPWVYAIDVYPTDPLLALRGVRYAAFPDEVKSARKKGLRLIAHPLGNLIWIYAIARSR